MYNISIFFWRNWMIYLTGDTHGAMSINKLGKLNKIATKDDFVIILGDFGLIFNDPQTKEEKYWLKWLHDKKFTTLFVDGNHENFDLLRTYPLIEKFNGTVRKINDKLFQLERGQIYTIENKTFLTMGGANSIDKDYRLQYEHKHGKKIWWQQELWSFDEENFCFDNLNKYNNVVDYVLTHTLPESIIKESYDNYYYFDPLSRFLDGVKKYYLKDFTKWFCGHFHEDRILNDKFQICYDEIYDLNGKII